MWEVDTVGTAVISWRPLDFLDALCVGGGHCGDCSHQVEAAGRSRCSACRGEHCGDHGHQLEAAGRSRYSLLALVAGSGAAVLRSVALILEMHDAGRRSLLLPRAAPYCGHDGKLLLACSRAPVTETHRAGVSGGRCKWGSNLTEVTARFFRT